MGTSKESYHAPARVLSAIGLRVIRHWGCNRLTRQIEISPTAKIRSVAVGLAELNGKAVPLKVRSASAPNMRSRVESTHDVAPGWTITPSPWSWHLGIRLTFVPCIVDGWRVVVAAGSGRCRSAPGTPVAPPGCPPGRAVMMMIRSRAKIPTFL